MSKSRQIMKKIAVLGILLMVILFASCKEKEPARYATSGSEIDLMKSLVMSMFCTETLMKKVGG